jgi:hypothetical protein
MKEWARMIQKIYEVDPLTCPTVDAVRVRPTIIATDLILGRDWSSQRYI